MFKRMEGRVRDAKEGVSGVGTMILLFRMVYALTIFSSRLGVL